jgi:hypothetical protein
MPDKNLADWNIPMTDEFLDGVRRGLRRRRLMRGAAVGGALLAVAAVVTFTITRIDTPGPPQPGALPSTSGSPVGTVLDGFRITQLPDGAAQAGSDSTYTAAVTDKGLRNDGSTPAAGEPKASVTMRRFDRGPGVGLFVAVLRPHPGTDPGVGTAQIADWLTRWAAEGTSTGAFDVPVGTARLLVQAGSTTTAHRVVITTPDHVVITIEGNAAFTAAELETVARGITR